MQVRSSGQGTGCPGRTFWEEPRLCLHLLRQSGQYLSSIVSAEKKADLFVQRGIIAISVGEMFLGSISQRYGSGPFSFLIKVLSGLK